MKSILYWLKRIFLGFVILLILLIGVLWISFYFGRQAVVSQLPGNSSIIETEVGPIEYLIQGNSNKHVLLLHGTPLSYRTFGFDPLIESGYSLISPSRPGYFRTPLTVGASAEEQADAYAEFLKALKIDSVAVIAISGGGPSATQFALRHPELCKRLILLACPVATLDRDPPGFVMKLMQTEFMTWSSLNLMLAQFDDPDRKAEAELYVKSSMFPFSSTEVGKQNDFSIIQSLNSEYLENIIVPTLIVHGTADPIVPFSQARDAASIIPNATLSAKEGKNHFQVVFFEFDETLNETIDYLNEW